MKFLEVLKSCEHELSYILVVFWIAGRSHHVFKNVGERSTAKNYHPVTLFSAVSKVFKKLLNN